MGKHLEPDAPPPPPPHKSYKVIVALAAIVLLAVASMAVVAAFNPVGGEAQAGQTVDTPSLPVIPGGGESGPPSDVPTSQPTTGSLPTGRTPTVAPTSLRPTTPKPGQGGVSGNYQVAHEWTDRFEGVIVLVNTTNSDQAWKIVLKLPPDVKGYVTNWVEGGPMAAEARTGQTVTFEGVQTIPAHSPAVIFHFQFDKVLNSTKYSPTSCTVNGVACL